MTPWTHVVVGDCLEWMKYMPDQSIQCCVTSPPYYGLRDYGHAEQLGREKSPDEYVANLVAVFREVRRVLRDDGTFWLNIGDSYNNRTKVRSSSHQPAMNNFVDDVWKERAANGGCRMTFTENGLKEKDRLMIPARVALALQADGWWLRDEIVWHKPRTTPAPLKDRTVPAHEMVYLLTKKAHYYFDYLAVEEPAAYAGLTRESGKAFRDLEATDPTTARKRCRKIVVRETRRKRSVWSISPTPYKDGHFATFPPDLVQTCLAAGTKPGDLVLDPFGGAGTTGLVANRMGRNAIVIELNAEYAAGARRRIDRG